MSSKKEGGYVGRLAPTPSGLLHLGHFQTFFIAQERARRQNGRLLLRVEDLDTDRCKPHLLPQMLEDLQWMGFVWDPPACAPSSSSPRHAEHGHEHEHELDTGPKETYITQSKDLTGYRKALVKLYEGGFIYPSHATRREIQRAVAIGSTGAASAKTTGSDGDIIFPVHLRQPCPDPVDVSDPFTIEGVNWRFKVPYDSPLPVAFDDVAQGPQMFEAGKDFGDFVVWTKLGMPSYELAVVVDDAAQGITEVVRGGDLLLSTARQLLLYRALHLATPHFFHCPLVCDASGKRLAKRVDSEAISTLRRANYSPTQVRRELFQINQNDLDKLIQKSV